MTEYMIELPCSYCGKPVLRYKSKIRASGKVYCSRSCKSTEVGKVLGKVRHERAIAALIVEDQPQGYRVIRLNGDQLALVDIEDYDLALTYAWRELHGYAYYSSGNKKGLYLHRAIIAHILNRELTRAEVVDHENHDTLDNRRKNLRLTSQHLNQANMVVPKHNTSGFKGVHWNTARSLWLANIKHEGHVWYVGAYEDIEDAAYGYDQWAMQLRGEFALTNFEYQT